MAYVAKQENLLPQQAGVGFSVFDENDPRYRCCCGGKCHSRTGAMIIGVLSLISLIATTAREAYSYLRRRSSSGHLDEDRLWVMDSEDPGPQPVYGLVISAIGFAVVLVIVILLIVGIRKERAGYMIPYMVLHVLGIILMAVMMLMAILALAGAFVLMIFSENKNEQQSGRLERSRHSVSTLVAGMYLGVFALAIIFECWLFNVLLKCYRYLRDKQAVFMPVSQQHY